MKILLCSPQNVQGGITQWTKHIIEFYKYCNNKSIELDFFAMDRSGYIPEKLSIFKRVIWGVKDYMALSKELFKKVRTDDCYNIVHLASSASISLLKDIYILKKLKKQKVKTIIHFHFGRIPQLFEKQNWEWKLLKNVISLSTSVVVIDKSSYDTLIGAGFTNIYLLSNPLSPNVEHLIKENSELKRQHRKLLFAGHVIKTKGIFELIEACVDIPDIELKVVGKVLPNVEEELKKCWENGKGKLILTNNIPFEDVIKEMLSCSLFVLPTYTEGFPNVIIESMACGCSIITTPVGAIPEMLDIGSNKECGICVEVKSVKALKSAIIKLLEDRELANMLANNARSKVIERYSMEVVWTEIIDIWSKTLSM